MNMSTIIGFFKRLNTANKILLVIASLTYVSIISVNISIYMSGNSPIWMIGALSLIAIVGVITIFSIYKKNNNSVALKYVAFVFFIMQYVLKLFFERIDTVYLVGFIFGAVYILYYELKSVIIVSLGIFVINVVYVIYCAMNGC